MGLSTHQYIPASGYSDKRQLGPPRVNLPPPELDYHDGKPTYRVHALPFINTSTRYGNPEFLKLLAANHAFYLTHSMLTWKYEMRRLAQAILPFLFLGPSSIARDSDFVKSAGITLLVAARSTKSIQTLPTFLDPSKFSSSKGIQTLTFDYDHQADFISRAIPTICAINNHLESTCIRAPGQDDPFLSGKVLIFCETGNDRSALLTAAYLVTVFGIDAIAAVHAIQSQRFCIGLNDDMKNILFDLEAITRAERQVSQAKATFHSNSAAFAGGRSCETPLQRRSKRGIDEFYMSDVEMEDEGDQRVDSLVREGVAPFTDAVP